MTDQQFATLRGRNGVSVADFFQRAIPQLAAARNASLKGKDQQYASAGVSVARSGLGAAFEAVFGVKMSVKVGERPSKTDKRKMVGVYDGPLAAAERAGIVKTRGGKIGPTVYLTADFPKSKSVDGAALAESLGL
jgi:hypothetical protein